MLLLLAQRLSSTASTAQRAAAQRLVDFFNRDVWPVVPEQGALGATDAVPLAHLCLPLLGLGEVDYQGYRLASADVLGLFGWEAVALPEAAGRALLDGQEFTLAYATEALERAEHLLRAADALRELSAAATGAAYTIGYQSPTYETSRAAVAYVAQAVQQACNAGAAVARTSEREADSVNSPLALVLDHLAPAAAALGSLSGQRTGQLLAGHHGLPPALATPGLPLGLAGPYRTAASLAGQNRQLCGPTSASPWDDWGGNPGELPSLGTQAATRALRAVENTEQILGIELLVAAQALDLHRTASSATLGGSPALAAVAAFREHVTFVAHARVLAPDLHRAARFVREYHWT